MLYKMEYVLCLSMVVSALCLVEFNNVRCVPYNKNTSDFEYCYLKSVNRTYKYLSLKVHFLYLPINKATVKAELFRHDSSSSRNRVLQTSVDACKFMRNRANPTANLIFNLFGNHTNLNHTCPYNNDVYLEKLPVSQINGMIQNVIPNNRYVLKTTWIIEGGVIRNEIFVYFTKS